jgi:nucleotidyltransferase/DNA polymerase involved in DNA repair
VVEAVIKIVDEMRAAGATTEAIEIVEEEIADEATEAIKKSNRRLPEFTIAQKIRVLDYYLRCVTASVEFPKKATVAWTKTEFERPSFS